MELTSYNRCEFIRNLLQTITITQDNELNVFLILNYKKLRFPCTLITIMFTTFRCTNPNQNLSFLVPALLDFSNNVSDVQQNQINAADTMQNIYLRNLPINNMQNTIYSSMNKAIKSIHQDHP